MCILSDENKNDLLATSHHDDNEKEDCKDDNDDDYDDDDDDIGDVDTTQDKYKIIFHLPLSVQITGGEFKI